MPKRLSSTCPPGVWCLTPSLGFLFALLISTILIYLAYTNYSSSSTIVYKTEEREVLPVQTPILSQGGDSRYARAPEPLRLWQTGPDLRGAMIPPGAVPINVSTRGMPQSFQQMGIIKVGEQVLPLYGRQTAYRSDRYNYYTRTDTYNPVQLPVRFERRDCMDGVGCGELFGGEHVKVSGINKEGDIEIYKFDGPAYIPGIV